MPQKVAILARSRKKAPSDALRKVFSQTATEEQSHQTLIQDALKAHFPESDFVLTPEDKELVIVGPRMLEVVDRTSTERALELIYESEKLTRTFYAALHDVTGREELKTLLNDMADACRGHVERLKALQAGE